jgi:glycosyltransferase involved in cell wall biosynthesis
MPLVSVLMVFHRDTPFLRPAIASVLGQTLADFELVLVDNGTGLTGDALGELDRDSRIRWIRRPQNGGIPTAHNEGVRAAAGEYIALLDYDDIALPNRLARQVEALRANAKLGLVSSLAETIDEQGRVVGREFALVEPAAQRRYTQFAAPVVTPAYAGRREVFQRVPYRTELPHAADFDFLARAAEAYDMAAVPEVLLRYRRYPAQTTQAHAADIETERALVRVATARRRSGRDEALGELVRDCIRGVAAAKSCAWWARQNLADDFPILAAYHSRRSFALDRGPANAIRALRIGMAAISRASRGDRSLALRLFLTGPVSALRLRPA